jgi:sugar lactone lactonase YvrE
MKKELSDLIIESKASNLLGECPVWCEQRESLFWVDIEACLLQEIKFPAKKLTTWKLPEPVGMLAVQDTHHLILALQTGLIRFDLRTANIEWLLDIEKEINKNRSNDGKCDAKGRLWLGTMHLKCADHCGSLYMIDEDLNLTKKIDNLTISNGIAWSLDNRRMFFIDSSTYRVDAYHFDLETGNIEFEKTAITISEELGMPDGMTIDEEGMLWVAHWNGFAVRRWNPETGELLQSIEVPVLQVTSLTFGGKHLNQLFITSAKTGLSDEQLRQYPLSGHLFSITLPVKGLPSNHCKLHTV